MYPMGDSLYVGIGVLKRLLNYKKDTIDEVTKREMLLTGYKEYAIGEALEGADQGERVTIRISDTRPVEAYAAMCAEADKEIFDNLKSKCKPECDHEWINAGFTSLRWVCKKCDAEKPSS